MAQVDGVFQLDAVADDLVHESFECDTRDHEDHTFCGVSVQRARRTCAIILQPARCACTSY